MIVYKISRTYSYEKFTGNLLCKEISITWLENVFLFDERI